MPLLSFGDDDDGDVTVGLLYESRGWSGEFAGFFPSFEIAFIPVPLASPLILFKNDNIKETVGSLRELVEDRY